MDAPLPPVSPDDPLTDDDRARLARVLAATEREGASDIAAYLGLGSGPRDPADPGDGDSGTGPRPEPITLSPNARASRHHRGALH
ncbi:hypothetical protein [Nocardiopsis sp. MG754419]|uniref:hypothetical protein n=1 Tax=Nocardiopsis sp. MG754419 TaxID=2259865 RepID=UPI001BA57734|nr:hypothetical protein [Nocardiopsis sp. MG754419]MBR8743683.1 hypothetical protein [Nocardiopsis sp. MG754419]